MEMLEEQQREEMELAALQEEQEYEQVRQQRNSCKTKLCNLDLRNFGKMQYNRITMGLKPLKTSKS